MASVSQSKQGKKTTSRKRSISKVNIKRSVNAPCSHALLKYEQNLIESEKKYRDLVELAHEGITTVDQFSIFTFVNRQFAESLGYKVDDLIGKDVFFLANKETAVRMRKETKKRKQGKKSRYEVALIHKDGYIKYFWLSVSPRFDSNNKFIGSRAVYSDITERKKAEEALKESEERYRSIIDQSHMGFVITDNEKIVHVNKKMLKMAGVSTVNQLIGRNFLKNVSSEYIEKIKYNLKKRSSCINYSDIDEYAVKRSNGRKMYYQAYSKGIVLNGHNMTQTFVIDITDKKEMELDLEKSVNQINALYEVSAHARSEKKLPLIFKRTVVSINKALPFEEYAQSQIIFDKKTYSYPKKTTKFFSKIETPLIVDGVKRGLLRVGYRKRMPALENDDSYKKEHELINNVVKILCKHMYAREIINRHEEIITRAFTSIVVVRGKNIKFANPRFYSMFKVKKNEVLGRPLASFLPSCRPTKNNIDNRVKEYIGKQGNGNKIQLEVTMLHTKHQGKPAILIRINDITALKQAQAKLKNFNKELRSQVKEKTQHLEDANKRLKSLNNLKDEFIAITSHELRSPLTSIRGYLSFLTEDEPLKKLEDPYREYLLRAYSTTDSLNYLINNILDVSRLNMGRFELQIRDTNIVRLTKSIVDSLSFQAGENRLCIEFNDKTGDSELIVPVDSIRISQVLRNILDNSIKFSKRGKKIFVNIIKFKKFVRIVVVDQGVGIPKAKLEQVFDKFMQVKNINTKYKGGVGLGLFITKRIVELHGGKILADQNEYGGTSVSIDLPITINNVKK